MNFEDGVNYAFYMIQQELEKGKTIEDIINQYEGAQR